MRQGRETGDVAGQRRFPAIRTMDAHEHTVRGDVERLGVAVEREQNTPGLAPQHGGVGGGQPARARQKTVDRVRPRRAGGIPHRAVERRIALQRHLLGRRLLGHRHARVDGGAGEPDRGRRCRLLAPARQAREEKGMDGSRSRKVGIAIEPSLERPRLGLAEAAKVAVGQHVAEHGLPEPDATRDQAAVKLVGLTECLGDAAMPLEIEDAAIARGLGRGQRLRQREAGPARRRKAWHHERKVARPRKRWPSSLGVCLRGRSAGQNRCPGKKRPGGGKAGERRSGPSHAARLHGIGSEWQVGDASLMTDSPAPPQPPHAYSAITLP